MVGKQQYIAPINEIQYNWAQNRIEELLPFVNDETPTDDPKYIELVLISNLVGDYEDINYPIGKPSEMLKLRIKLSS